ncbi:ATP-dependent zinc protease family protein [Amphritea balenae]|uniref:ATP-dependent Zn protease n=1 Tax=Amphritea balenae TaxID=452629 RepID=A0A3P1SSE8_9GAMM|nr:RimK/LysX family protein [Amphritea balenae]RRD00068.1 ATP-dependent Zn protease [Amphritea balenae]GGK76313.1 hypothetical protein GCM10007941_28110 [Amphritea balenae]
MRALILCLALLLLQGCIATKNLQRENIQLSEQAIAQCQQLQPQLDKLVATQSKTNQLIKRESDKRQALLVQVQSDQSCSDLRQSLNNKTVVGDVEWAWIDFGSHQSAVKVRMDTGASTSSISAKNVTEFERNGKRWVRFTLEDGREVSMLVERYANIRQAATEKDRRWVVKLGIRLGTISQVAEFTLKDRSHLNYEVLVGRNLLRDLMVVDVARRYILGKQPAKQAEAVK